MSTVLKDKMYNYEVSPPPAVWNNISASLDDADLSLEYPSVLRGLSVNPPASAWNRIAASLPVTENITPAKVRSLFPSWIKYAAAAAILAFLAWGGYTLFSSSENSTQGLATGDKPRRPATVNPQNTVPLVNPGSLEADRTLAQDDRDDAALEASKKTYAKLSSTPRTKIRNAADFYFTPPEDAYYGPAQTRGLDFMDETTSPNSIDLSNRYIMLMTPDGHIIRISKKLSNMVCCVAGEEEDADCTDRMKELREKMASPSATQSPADFMDILSLLRSL